MLAQGSGAPPPTWDVHLDAIGGHFLQSRSWALFQEALGEQLLWAGGDGWCWLGIVRERPGFRDLYLPYGPAATGPTSFDAALSHATQTGRNRGFDMVRVEPWGGVDATMLRPRGARPTAAIQPQFTWVIDLIQSEEALLRGLSENRRRNVRTAERKGLRIRRSQDPSEADRFISLLGATAERGHFNVHADRYYRVLLDTLLPRGAASLYFADTGGDPFAGIIGFHQTNAAYYAHAAADQQRSRTLSAPGPLAWRMLLDARAAGCTRYDFWGVAPNDSAEHPWAGLSRFKRGFGGNLHRTAGTWDVPLSRPKYALYRVARRLLG